MFTAAAAAIADEDKVLGLAAGMWATKMVSPGGHEVDVVIKVDAVMGRPNLTMSVPGSGVIPLKRAKRDGDKLTFTFRMATEVSCELTRGDDGAFEGPCSDEAADRGSLRMEPPAET